MPMHQIPGKQLGVLALLSLSSEKLVLENQRRAATESIPVSTQGTQSELPTLGKYSWTPAWQPQALLTSASQRSPIVSGSKVIEDNKTATFLITLFVSLLAYSVEHQRRLGFYLIRSWKNRNGCISGVYLQKFSRTQWNKKSGFENYHRKILLVTYK